MTQTVQDKLLLLLEKEFQTRRFTAGLLLSFISFIKALGAGGGKYASWVAFEKAFPPQTSTGQGKAANTLIVPVGDGSTLSIRKFYGQWERVIRADNKRFDYPNCAPHATQAWRDYIPWFVDLLGLNDSELDAFAERVLAKTLEWLPTHEYQGEALPPSRPFSDLLGGFDFSPHKKEPAGGAFQGLAYAYIRADAPHLHLDISKVGAGSKRLQRVGDVDGWSGERLVLSAEVKHFTFKATDIPAVAAFLGETARRGAVAMIVAEHLPEDARERLKEEGAVGVDLDDLVRMVSVWDPLKQEAAFLAFEYYVHHIEKNMPLIERLRDFMHASGLDIEP